MAPRSARGSARRTHHRQATSILNDSAGLGLPVSPGAESTRILASRRGKDFPSTREWMTRPARSTARRSSGPLPARGDPPHPTRPVQRMSEALSPRAGIRRRHRDIRGYHRADRTQPGISRRRSTSEEQKQSATVRRIARQPPYGTARDDYPSTRRGITPWTFSADKRHSPTQAARRTE